MTRILISLGLLPLTNTMLSANISAVEKTNVGSDSYKREPPPFSKPFDMKAYSENWDDMLRCQKEGIYPKSFISITLPVLMLHGNHAPTQIN